MPDFFSAARRHLDDGDFLHQHARHTNAVQLWAYGGECMLKAMALQYGWCEINPKGKPTNHFGQHLNQNLSNNVPDLLSLYNAKQTGTTALMGPQTAFLGWDINERYEDGSHLQAKIDEYKSDAAFFRTMLNRAMLPEGL
jgi:hypothetical protein